MDRTQIIADRYCAAVAERLDAAPEAVMAHARRYLEFVERQGSASPQRIARWRAVLDAGPVRVRAVLLSGDPDCAELRRNHPFPALLPESLRQQFVREAFRESPTA